MYVEVHLRILFSLCFRRTKARKEFALFSIIWLQQVGHCMNEIAIIEFESFGAVGEDVVALKLSSTSYPT